jgi:hypothetical protein
VNNGCSRFFKNIRTNPKDYSTLNITPQKTACIGTHCVKMYTYYPRYTNGETLNLAFFKGWLSHT